MQPPRRLPDPLPEHGAPWLEALRMQGRSPRTVSTYAAALLNFQRFLQKRGRSELYRLRAIDLVAWQQSLHDSGCALCSQEQFTRTIGYWFRWLCESGVIFSNPAARLRRPKLPKTLPRCPTEAEMTRLLRSIVGPNPIAIRNRALLELAYACGARLEELARLQVASVDLEQSLVRLRGKGERERLVPLTRLAVKALVRYLRRARTQLLRAKPDHGALFIGIRDGRRLTTMAVAQVVIRAGCRVGLQITPHDVRRAFATHLLRGGAHPADLMLLLGHQSYSHLNHYLQVNPEHLKLDVHRRRRFS